jgi:hypothetical protein
VVKIRNLNQLQDALDSEMAWRVKEISDLKFAIREANPLSEKTLTRAGLALLYSHWEGFVKAASLDYLNFVDNQGHLYRDLQSCFIVLGVKGRIDTVRESKKSEQNVQIVDFLVNELGKPTRMQLSTAIKTESNLRSHVFENIANSLNIPLDWYRPRYNLIDISLVDRRNAIAHGEYIDINPSEWRSLADEVLTIMRAYKTDIENAAVLKLYKRLVDAII